MAGFRALVRRRATWRWCLAGGGALLILLGIAMGIPTGGASSRSASHRRVVGDANAGNEFRPHSLVVGPTSSVASSVPAPGANPSTQSNLSTNSDLSTGLGTPLPVGSSDGTSLGSVVEPTTLPSVRTLGVVDTPPAVESVPITTAAAVLIAVVACGAFGAGWSIGRRRAVSPN